MEVNSFNSIFDAAECVERDGCVLVPQACDLVCYLSRQQYDAMNAASRLDMVEKGPVLIWNSRPVQKKMSMDVLSTVGDLDAEIEVQGQFLHTFSAS